MNNLITFGVKSLRVTFGRRLVLHALVLMTLFSSVGVLFAPRAAAAGESYKWTSSSTIQVSGGDLSASYTMNVSTDPATKRILAGGTTELEQDGDDFCKPVVLAQLNEDRKGGTIISARINPSTGAPGSPGANCSEENQDIMNDWAGSTISVSGDVGAETDEQKKVDIVYYTLLKKNESPAKVTFTTEGPGDLYAEFDSNKGTDGNYYGTFVGITAGEWTFCVQKSGKVPKTCETFTKNAYQKGLVVLGESRDETANRIAVQVEVNPVPADPAKDETFGPFAIELRDKDGNVLKTKDISLEYVSTCELRPMEACGGGVLTMTESFLYKNVKPGDYKVCYGNTCVDAKKIDNKPLSVVLKFSQSDIEESGSGTDSGPEETSCAVDGIGWIVCPVMNFMAKLNDAAFEFLQSFLTIRPALISDDNTLKAWSSFRDLANVAFVIAFMVIVYSQITSAGVSNYGIKKLLPRIVVAAILVNISYYICALAVDLSNIVGSSAYSLLKDSINVGGAGAAATGWEGTMEGILKGAAIGIGVILLLLAVAMAPTALLAFGLILLILIARQAFVILLVVISPLAFVAYLLPNTEDWFKKWWKAFTATLMVYPIVAIVFGASTLASNIISGVKDGTDADLLQIIALGVLAVPLFAVPALLKGSLSAAGSVGAKLQGLADKTQGRAGKQIGGKVSKRAERIGNRFKAANVERASKIATGAGGRLGEAGTRRRRLAGALAGLGSTAAVNNAQKDKYAEIAASAASRDYVAKRAVDDAGYARALAGGRLTPGSKALASDIQSYAVQERRESQQKDIKAAREKIANAHPDTLLPIGGSFDEKMSGADLAARAAEIAARGPGRQFHAALNASAQIEDDEKRQMVQKALLDNKREDHFGLADEDVGALSTGRYGLAPVDGAGNAILDDDGNAKTAITYEDRLIERSGKKMGGEKLAGLKKHDIETIAKISDGKIDGKTMSDDGFRSLVDSIADARGNENISGKLTTETKAFHETILKAAAARGITMATPAATPAAPAPAPTPPTPPAGGGPATP